MPRPNFFIVGAPKCGTSSLHDYMGQHPQVFMSKLKEPLHFGRDLEINSIWCYRDDQRYLKLFDGAGGARRIGESSAWYLYSTTAAAEIHDFDPQAKIIAMLRQPVDAMYSLHGQFLYSANEDIPDFGQALAAQEQRRLGQRIPATAAIPKALLYSQVYDYTEQVRRYFDVFGRENVMVILFDDFVRNTEKIYRQVLEFLELDSGFAADLRVVNPAKPVSPRLSGFLGRRPWLRKLAHTLVPPSLQQGAMNLLYKLTGTLDRPARIPAPLRAQLLPPCVPQIRQLAQLLGRDLELWCR